MTAQAYNAYGYSAPTDPEFAIPVADSGLAITAHPDRAAAVPSELQLTGIAANASGFYPVTKVKVYIGPMLRTCAPNPFGECLIRATPAPSGVVPVYSTYTGWSGRLVSLAHVPPRHSLGLSRRRRRVVEGLVREQRVLIEGAECSIMVGETNLENPQVR